MVDYTEKATLLLIDRSSKQIDVINKSLGRLQKTATQTQKALSAIGKSDGSNSAVRSLNNLTTAINRTASAAKKLSTIKVRVQMSGATSAQMNAMARAMSNYKNSTKGVKTLVGAGGASGSYKNLDTLAEKLTKVARAANLAAMKIGQVAANTAKINANTLRGLNNLGNPNHPVNNPPRPPRTPGGGGHGGGGAPFWSPNPQGPHLIGFDLNPLRTVLHAFVVDLAREIARSVREGFVEGTKGFDVANNKMLQQQLPEGVRNNFRTHAFEASRANPQIRPDERMDLYAEVATNYKNPEDALRFDKALDKIVSISIQQGQSSKEAIEGIQQLFRGLGQAGILQTNTGDFNPQVFDYINAFSSAKISEGKQIDWNQIFQFFKQSKTAGQSISPNELFYALINAADVGGATAGTQFNMNQRTFTGETTKKAIRAQEAAGLRGPSQRVAIGTDGKGRTTYSLEAGTLKDEELFRENAHQWVQKYIMGKGGFLEKQGIDIATAKPSTVISALNPLSGNRNSQDFLAKAVLQFQEDLIKADKFFGQNGISDEGLKAINDQSVWVNYQATIQQTTTMLGLMGEKLSEVINGPMKLIRDVEQQIIDMINPQSKSNVGGAALIAGAGAGAIGAGFAGVKLLQWLTGAMGLNASAAALTGSAAQLTLAARALMGAAGVNGAMPDVPGGGKKAGLLAGIGGFLARTVPVAVAAYMLTDTSPGPSRDKLLSSARGQDANQIQNWAVQAASLQGQINDIDSQISGNRKAGRADDYGFNFDPIQQKDRLGGDRNMIVEQMNKAQLDLAATLQAGGGRIEAASDQFGPNAASALLGVASAFGETAGAAIRAAMQQVQLQLNAQVPVPAAAPAAVNTGTNTNLATGG